MEYFGVTMLLKCADPHLPTDRNNRQEWIDPETQLCVVEIAGAVYAVLSEIVQSFWPTFLQFKAVPVVSSCGEGRTQFKGTDTDCPFGWLGLKLPLHPFALFLLVLMRRPPSLCLCICRCKGLLLYENLSCVLCTALTATF